MSETVKPALTVEEWENRAAYREGSEISVFDNGQMLIDNGENVGGGREFCHAIAALALYGQPFGFTRADVELLRRFAGRFWAFGGQAELENLTERIDALLPQEKK